METQENPAISMATRELQRLRESESSAEMLRDILREAGLEPADIGTSEEELAHLDREYNIIRSKEDVDHMREEPFIGSEFVRERIQARGLILSDVGTSEEELREADISHGKYLVEGVSTSNRSLKEVRDHLKWARLSLRDLGTTWAEIKRLRRASVVAFCVKLVQEIREGKTDPRDLASHLTGEGYILTPKEVGTTWAEIKRLSRVYALAEAKRLVSQMRGAIYQGSEVRSRLKDLGITCKAAGTSRSELAAARWGPNDWITRLQTK